MVRRAAAAEEKRLFIYNWTDFIGPDTIAEFEKQSGIKVTYDVYDSEETMDARLLAGSSGYDVVIASTEYFGREIKAGVYIPLDKSKLPNWKNLDPRILAIQSRSRPRQCAFRALHACHQWLCVQRGHDQGAHAERTGRQPRHDIQAGNRRRNSPIAASPFSTRRRTR